MDAGSTGGIGRLRRAVADQNFRSRWLRPTE